MTTYSVLQPPKGQRLAVVSFVLHTLAVFIVLERSLRAISGGIYCLSIFSGKCSLADKTGIYAATSFQVKLFTHGLYWGVPLAIIAWGLIAYVWLYLGYSPTWYKWVLRIFFGIWISGSLVMTYVIYQMWTLLTALQQ